MLGFKNSLLLCQLFPIRLSNGGQLWAWKTRKGLVPSNFTFASCFRDPAQHLCFSAAVGFSSRKWVYCVVCHHSPTTHHGHPSQVLTWLLREPGPGLPAPPLLPGAKRILASQHCSSQKSGSKPLPTLHWNFYGVHIHGIRIQGILFENIQDNAVWAQWCVLMPIIPVH